MAKISWLALVVILGAGLSSLSAQTTTPKYVPVTKYDPQRNADQDIREAVAEAHRTHRRVLLEVGGEWCSWCHTLDNYFDAHRELTALRNRNFVTVKINFSEENQNREVLSRYPPIPGYPHLFVLDSDGRFLHSQDTSSLESGKSYDLERLTDFLKRWSLSESGT
jgi:thiol:disulfide interchange protein